MYIKVRVLTAQRKEGVAEGKKPSDLVVSVREKPEKGAANRRVLQLLRGHFGNPEGGVKIVAGHTSPSKIVRVGR